MKRTLKLLLIFAGSLVSVIVCSLTGYFLISKNKTFHIYDIRLVELDDTLSGYIYTDDEVGYTSIKNQTVYMNSSKTNIYPIAVYLSTSSGSTNVSIVSSDPSVAKIIYKDGGCFVQYLKEGFATITSEFYGVKDSFDIQIFDQVPNEFIVYDYEYYGDYAELFPNKILTYADENEYRYGFLLNNAAHTGNNSNIDSDLIEIDQACLDDSIFESAYIDSETDELVLKCKIPETTQTDDIDDIIILQSFYYDENGDKMDGKTYKVDVHVVQYIPEFLQIEVSSSPNFGESVVYTHYVKNLGFKDDYTNQDIVDDPKLLNDYLRAEKEENFIAKNGEFVTHDLFLTNKVSRLYLKFRMVYSNGDIYYLNSSNSTFGWTGDGYCILGPSKDYYELTIDDSFFDSQDSFDITLSLKNFEESNTFSVYFSNDWRDFYEYDEDAKVYNFKYWDKRARFKNVITDEFGNVTGFGSNE